MTDKHGNRSGYPQSHGDAPAFPVSVPGCGDNGWHGMSLRDWFAGQVMSHMISLTEDAHGGWDPVAVAVGCYALADAMIAERAAPTTAKCTAEN